MRKVVLCCMMAVLGWSQAEAQRGYSQASYNQTNELGVFNHVGLGVGFGTSGITADVAFPITPHVALRGGIDWMPKVAVPADLDLNLDGAVSAVPGVPSEVEVEGKLDMTTGHVLFDFFPSKNSSFHITAGAYFGKEKVVSVYNTEDGLLKPIATWNAANPSQPIGLELGDYLLTPDQQGNVDATLRVKSFRPYLGLGFGRPVPIKHRFTCNFDLGVQFWGSPEVYLRDTKLEESNLDSDAGSVLKTISKVSVWPVLNFRLVGRIL